MAKYQVISAIAIDKKTKVHQYGEILDGVYFDDPIDMVKRGFLKLVESDLPPIAETDTVIIPDNFTTTEHLVSEVVVLDNQPQEVVLDESVFFGKRSKKSK